MGELRHECGVAAVYHLADGSKSSVWSGDPDQVTRLMPRMLLDLQNRGQLAAGMASYNPARDQLLDTYKEIGPVAEAFRMSQPHKYESVMDGYAGRAAIGHVRYATCGPTSRGYAQPFERRHGNKWKWFAFAFNGNLANFEYLREEILSLTEFHLTRDNDTEVIMHHLSHALRGDHRPDMAEVFADLSKKFDGAYNLAMLNAMGDMVVLRDPLGLRPMCYAIDGPLFAAASESVALQNLGFKSSAVKSLEPGEMVLIRDGKITFHRFAPKQPPAHCFFEWIYFANVASVLDDRSVYLSRAGLGKELARQERELGLVPLDDGDTIVVPVPDTGKAAADAMAYELGIPAVEGLIRNRYVGRTFIEGGNRADKVRLKFTPLRQVLEGKRVLLVEDSIVRSTTLRNLLSFIREQGGAAEVHVRVACPPIVAPCFYGIDMSTIDQLFAPKFMAGGRPTLAEQKAMADTLGADTLLYLPLEAIARCVGLPEAQLCRACLTGDYPTESGRKRYSLELAKTAPPERDAGDGSPCRRPARVG